MKRILAIVLLAALCLSLVACGGDKGSKVSLVGKWHYAEEQVDLTINADKTGSMVVGERTVEFTWKFSAESNLLLLTSTDGEIEEVNYFKEDDTLYADGWTFTRVK
jgi:hypothetical protein